MNWITRERPKIDRLACPWLIKRFIDAEAKFYFVPYEQVEQKSRDLSAVPFDVPDVEFTHYGDQCTFDYFVSKYKIDDPAIKTIALIVRGADTDRHDLASQASGLWAISAGLAYNTKDDYDLLQQGMTIYDGLYSWARHLQQEKHTQNPLEKLLLDVYQRFLKTKPAKRKAPAWARELKEIIQDQIDTNLSLSLKELSQTLEVHPAYLSREFSKYFDDLSFGEYIRKLRIEKALQLLQQGHHSLSEIAYLTGFSDQSHFARVFGKHAGVTPSAYKKSMATKGVRARYLPKKPRKKR